MKTAVISQSPLKHSHSTVEQFRKLQETWRVIFPQAASLGVRRNYFSRQAVPRVAKTAVID